jgi:hypothetical protein
MRLEAEDEFLDPAIRHDLRHMMSHGACRYTETLKLYRKFKAANGKAPDNIIELVNWLRNSKVEMGKTVRLTKLKADRKVESMDALLRRANQKADSIRRLVTAAKRRNKNG